MATVDFFLDTDKTTASTLGLTWATTGTYWAVSFDAGSSATPVADSDTISFSSATLNAGTLRKVILLDGAWTGTARGIIIFDSDGTGSAPGDGETITFTGSGASATTRLDGSGFWDSSNGDAGCFDRGAEAVALLDNWSDTGSDTANIWAAGTTADAPYTAAAHSWSRVLIRGEDGTADGIATAPTDGRYTSNNLDISTSNYRVAKTSGFGYAIEITGSNYTLRGIQALATGASTGHALGCTGTGGGINIEESRFQMNYTAGPTSDLDSSGSTNTVSSCLFENAAADDSTNDAGIDIGNTAGLDWDIRNVWFLGNAGTGRGLNHGNSTSGCNVSNCVFTDWGEDVRDSGATFTGNDNATDKASAMAEIGTGAILSIAVTDDWTGATDFRPVSGGALDSAADSDAVPARDISGNTFSNSNVGPYNELTGGGGANDNASNRLRSGLVSSHLLRGKLAA